MQVLLMDVPSSPASRKLSGVRGTFAKLSVSTELHCESKCDRHHAVFDSAPILGRRLQHLFSSFHLPGQTGLPALIRPRY